MNTPYRQQATRNSLHTLTINKLFALLFIGMPGISYAAQEFTLGVFPYLPAAELQERYAPVADDYSKVLGAPVHLKTRISFKNFRESMAKEEYDIIFIQPFDYIRVAVAHGYTAISRSKGVLNAVFVTRQDTSITSIAQLKGKLIAMPPKNAAVSLLGKNLLQDNGLIPNTDVRISYLRNHFACMKKIVIRKADVCVTAVIPRNMFERRSGVMLKTLIVTQPVPTALFAVHKRVSVKDRRALLARMVNWSKTKSGKKILTGLQFDAVIPASDHDYDVVRKIWSEVSK